MRKIVAPIVVLLAVVVAGLPGLATSAPRAHVRAASTVDLRPCPHIDGAECGSIRVPLDPRDLDAGDDRRGLPPLSAAAARTSLRSGRSSPSKVARVTPRSPAGGGTATCTSRSSIAAICCWWISAARAARMRSIAPSSSRIGGRGSGSSRSAAGSSARSRSGTAARSPPRISSRSSTRSASTGSISTATRTARSSRRRSRFAIRSGPGPSRSTARIPIDNDDAWWRDTNRAIAAAFRETCARDRICAADGRDPMDTIARLARRVSAVADRRDGVQRRRAAAFRADQRRLGDLAGHLGGHDPDDLSRTRDRGARGAQEPSPTVHRSCGWRPRTSTWVVPATSTRIPKASPRLRAATTTRSYGTSRRRSRPGGAVSSGARRAPSRRSRCVRAVRDRRLGRLVLHALHVVHPLAGSDPARTREACGGDVSRRPRPGAERRPRLPDLTGRRRACRRSLPQRDVRRGAEHHARHRAWRPPRLHVDAGARLRSNARRR